MTTYPAKIDTTQSLPTAIDGITPVQGLVFNRLRDAVIAIEEELGLNPAGVYGSLAARLGTLEGVVGNLQIIELDGDLGGTLETPVVVALQTLPVSSAIPNFNDVLTWDGIAWVPAPAQTSGGGGGSGFIPSGDLAGDGYHQIVIGLQGKPIANIAPNTGQGLVWNGTDWAPGAAGGSTSILTLQPGGTPNGTNVFDTWTALWNVRSNIEGPVTINIDFSHANTINVDAGVWDLGGNTPIISSNCDTNGNQVFQVPSGAQLLNAHYFEGLNITLVTGSIGPNHGVYPIDYTLPVTVITFVRCLNTNTISGGGTAVAGVNLSGIAGLSPFSGETPQVYLYSTQLGTIVGIPVFDIGSSFLIAHLYDEAFITQNQFTGTGGTVDIDQATHTGFVSPTQAGVTNLTITGFISNNFESSPNGSVLTKTSVGNATWETLSPAPTPAALTYQPGGPTNGPTTFNNWASLWALRSTVNGSIPIYIDDSYQTPAMIPAGVWDLQNITPISGVRKSGNQTIAPSTMVMGVADGAQLLNPSELSDLRIIGFGSVSGLSSFDAGGTGLSPNCLEFKAYNVLFNLDGSATQPLLHGFGGCNISLFESSAFQNPGGSNPTFILSNPAQHDYTVNLYDNATVDAQTIRFNSLGFTVVTINVYSLSATYNPTQSIVPAVTVNGVTPGGSLAGGSLSTAQVVQVDGQGTNTYTGSGTATPISSTSTSLTGPFGKVDSFVGGISTTVDGYSTIATIPWNSQVSYIDASISVIGASTVNTGTGDFWRGDLVFTISNTSGTPTLWGSTGIVTSIAAINIRQSGTLTTAAAQVIISGANVLVQVKGYAITSGQPIDWSIIGQLQYTN